MVEQPTPSSEEPSGDAPTDRSLLLRLRAGKSDAATELYLRYADRLQALAARQVGVDLGARVDPEDIVQSVFRTFFRRAERGEYDVPAGDELWKLLLVITLNKVRATGAFHRAAKRDVRQTVRGESYDRALQGKTSRDEASLTTLRLVVDEVLGGLSAQQRRIAELRIDGFEVDEIAGKTGRAKRSVERILQDFRRKLSALIGENA